MNIGIVWLRLFPFASIFKTEKTQRAAVRDYNQKILQKWIGSSYNKMTAKILFYKKKKTKPFFHLLALSFSVTQHSVLLVQALSITAKIFIMVVSLDLLISTQQCGQTSIFHSFPHLPYSLLPFLQPFIPLLSTLPHSILIKVLS